MLYVAVLLSTALAATPKEARRFFDRYVELADSHDPAFVDLFADDAKVRYVRDGVPSEMSGAQFKQLAASSREAAKAMKDRDEYGKVDVERDGEAFRISARRTSTLKCHTDDFALRVEERGGSLRIVDALFNTVGLSKCPAAPALAKQLELARASVDGKLPLALDDETRLDAVEVQGQALIYRMTLVKAVASEFDLNQLRGTLSQLALGQVCPPGAALQPLSKAGATVRYAFTLKDGTVIPPVDVSPVVCAQVMSQAAPR